MTTGESPTRGKQELAHCVEVCARLSWRSGGSAQRDDGVTTLDIDSPEKRGRKSVHSSSRPWAAACPPVSAAAMASPASYAELVASAERAIDALDYGLAASAYRAAAAARPGDASVLSALGEVLYLEGDLDEAATVC